MAAQKPEEKEYRALVPLEYLNEVTGETNHANAGDKVVGMSETVARRELRSDTIEEWVERDTSNGRDLEADAALYQYGVLVEDNGDGNMVVKGVNE